MAKLESELQFTGRLGELSAYKMKGVDKIILRRKGGPSAKEVKSSPAFANTRRNNSEFGGRSSAAKLISTALRGYKDLCDLGFRGRLTRLLHPLQVLDTRSSWGKRNIRISQNPRLMESLSIDRGRSFESCVKASLVCAINEERSIATIEVPDLIPGINLFNTERYPLYRIEITIACIPDIVYDGAKFSPVKQFVRSVDSVHVSSDWIPGRARLGSTNLSLDIPASWRTVSETTLLVVAALRFGTPSVNDTVETLSGHGCAKVILAL